MAKVDWSVLGAAQKGLAVEGKADKTVIEAFLSAGDGLHWDNWRAQLRVEDVGSSSNVLQAFEQGDARIWGLVDRDWRTDAELSDLVRRYPQLLVLPRVTIENYCIAPDDLANLLPPHHLSRLPNLEADIASFLDDWIQNGALWQILHEKGAHDFCRGHRDGYPMAILFEPVTAESEIKRQFQKWHEQLDPNVVLPAYRRKLETFRAESAQHYTHHVHGKYFFSQIIVQKILNRTLGQKKSEKWLDDLFSSVRHCPADIVPLLEKVVS